MLRSSGHAGTWRRQRDSPTGDGRPFAPWAFGAPGASGSRSLTQGRRRSTDNRSPPAPSLTVRIACILGSPWRCARKRRSATAASGLSAAAARRSSCRWTTESDDRQRRHAGRRKRQQRSGMESMHARLMPHACTEGADRPHRATSCGSAAHAPSHASAQRFCPFRTCMPTSRSSRMRHGVITRAGALCTHGGIAATQHPSSPIVIVIPASEGEVFGAVRPSLPHGGAASGRRHAPERAVPACV